MALVGGAWSASRLEVRAPSTHWTGGWVSLRTGMDSMDMSKFLILLGLKLDPSVVQPIASRYADYTVLDPSTMLYLQ
jgi:hypothetical protein